MPTWAEVAAAATEHDAATTAALVAVDGWTVTAQRDDTVAGDEPVDVLVAVDVDGVPHRFSPSYSPAELSAVLREANLLRDHDLGAHAEPAFGCLACAEAQR